MNKIDRLTKLIHDADKVYDQERDGRGLGNS